MRRLMRTAVVALAVILLAISVFGCSGNKGSEGIEGLKVTSVDAASGPRSGYQSVTIEGEGFTDVTSVTFGSSPAVGFTVADAGHIVAVTPVGQLGEAVDVTVTTADGTVTLTAAYTYWDYDLRVTKGTETVTYTVEELKAMPTVTGYWGAHKDPVPHDTDQYRGVSLLTIVEEVGGCAADEEIVVTSADDFTTVYTPEQLRQMTEGTYPMWNTNGTPVVTADTFALPIVAYEIDPQGDGSTWQPLDAGTGPLRMALVTTQDDRVSQGKYNSFLITSIEVRSAASEATDRTTASTTDTSGPATNVTTISGDSNESASITLDITSGPRSGYQNVTISGEGLEEVTAVSFGTKSALSFTVAGPTMVVAVTPPGELGQTVDVTVVTADGTITLSDAYSYQQYDLVLSKDGRTTTYTLEQIEAMSSVTGYWGAINDRPYATAEYKGVPLLTLLEAVGGWQDGETITVASADGFTTTYTSEQLRQMAEGTYPMWNTNGASVITEDRYAQLLLAYEIDGQPLKDGKGPFRIVVMTAEDDRLSQGPWNPALVVSVTVLDQ